MPRLVIVPGQTSKQDYEKAMLDFETQVIIEESQKTKPVITEPTDVEQEEVAWTDRTYKNYKSIRNLLQECKILREGEYEDFNLQHILSYLSTYDLHIPYEIDMGTLNLSMEHGSFYCGYSRMRISFTMDPTKSILNQNATAIHKIWEMLSKVHELINLP